MRIRQITSPVVCGEDHVGKWYCSDSIPGADGDPIIRYLQRDGTWGKTTDYFESETHVLDALALGHPPDFTVSRQEWEDRALIREMTEEALDHEYEDDLC